MKSSTLASYIYILCVHTIIFTKNDTDVVFFFPNIQTLVTYSNNLPEKPTPDSSDWHHVSYKDFFYSRSHPSIWDKIKLTLGMSSLEQHISDVVEKKFINQIKRTTNRRLKRGDKETFIRFISPEPGTRFIIMANLYGSFHSLVRFLQDWNRRGIIDENFNIKSPYVLIFDGNTLADSSYGIDTLALILQILELNTERVFFVRGNQEEKGRWQTTNINFEIEERIIPPQETKTLLGTLFDTLPLALYLIGNLTTSSIDLVRISNYALIDRKFDENLVASLFRESTRRTIRLDEQSPKHATSKVTVKAFIHGSANPTKAGKGLAEEGRQGNTLIWQAQSGNTAALQVLHRFFYESFVILDTAVKIDDWSMVLYYHDVRKQGSFEAYARYNVVTGELMPDKDVQETKIHQYQEEKYILKEKLNIANAKQRDLNKTLEKEKQQEELRSYSHPS